MDPPAKDCAELYRLGLKSEGFYFLDINNKRVADDGVPAFCRDGWTYVMRVDEGAMSIDNENYEKGFFLNPASNPDTDDSYMLESNSIFFFGLNNLKK